MFKRISSSKRKKSRKDNNESNVTRQEDLPQVWLAVQSGRELEEVGSQANLQMEDNAKITASTPKPKKKVTITDPLTQQQQRASVTSDDIIIPQEVETVGWGDQEELDYSKIIQSDQPRPPTSTSVEDIGLPMLSVVEDTRQRRPSGVSSSIGSIFSYAQSSSFQVNSLGKISSVSNEWIVESSPQSILKLIEMAQRHGDIPWKIEDFTECKRTLIISKYGLKVTDDRKQRVFGRFALHNIVNVIHYSSIYDTPMVIIRTIHEGHRNTNQECDLHIYECLNNDQASDICITLGQAFDTVINKMKMDENLHGPLI